MINENQITKKDLKEAGVYLLVGIIISLIIIACVFSFL